MKSLRPKKMKSFQKRRNLIAKLRILKIYKLKLFLKFRMTLKSQKKIRFNVRRRMKSLSAKKRKILKHRNSLINILRIQRPKLLRRTNTRRIYKTIRSSQSFQMMSFSLLRSKTMVVKSILNGSVPDLLTSRRKIRNSNKRKRRSVKRWNNSRKMSVKKCKA